MRQEAGLEVGAGLIQKLLQASGSVRTAQHLSEAHVCAWEKGRERTGEDADGATNEGYREQRTPVARRAARRSMPRPRLQPGAYTRSLFSST